MDLISIDKYSNSPISCSFFRIFSVLSKAQNPLLLFMIQKEIHASDKYVPNFTCFQLQLLISNGKSLELRSYVSFLDNLLKAIKSFIT